MKCAQLLTDPLHGTSSSRKVRGLRFDSHSHSPSTVDPSTGVSGDGSFPEFPNQFLDNVGSTPSFKKVYSKLQ